MSNWRQSDHFQLPRENGNDENIACGTENDSFSNRPALAYSNLNKPARSESFTVNVPSCSSSVDYVVAQSNLTATSKEFVPSKQRDTNSGAIKKKQHVKGKPRHNNHWQNNDYGTSIEYNRFNQSKNKQTNNVRKDFEHVNGTDPSETADVKTALQGRTWRTNSGYEQRNSVRNGYGKYQKNANSKMFYSRNKSEYYDHDSYTNSRRMEWSTESWRKMPSNGFSSSKGKVRENGHSVKTLAKKLDACSQRERLEQMILKRMLECLVCCEKLRHSDKIWSCKQCYHILHLDCTIQWANSSKLESSWRCPACQNVCSEVPNEYRCYCGIVLEPQYSPSFIPHSCGEVCGRRGRTCEHKCTLLCHPGPCPDCTVMVPRKCGCGKTAPIVKCGSQMSITCQGSCDKVLNCGMHKCQRQCHPDACPPCDVKLKQECYCGKVSRYAICNEQTKNSDRYTCGEVCDKTLKCGNHKCKMLCHEGECEPCTLGPDRIRYCPCGQTKLNVERISCLDPIPCCDKICSKPLKCGQPSRPHHCKEKCHEGNCPPCHLTTLVRCRCGHMDKEIPCVNVTTKADDARCGKKCTKKRLCGKHKCNQLCCIEVDHICPLLCNRQLTCGLHRCMLTCHTGRCPPCTETSFEELYCECGASVLYPPIACGTRPPPCSKDCSRPRLCGHDVNHNCHTGSCPPCTVLCKRWCFGHHEQRSAIPCYQDDFSCGLPCGKELPCGRHRCIQTCHTGDCPTTCSQPCNEIRKDCQHSCLAPCHDLPCPLTPCKQMVRVTCECGLRSSSRPCVELTAEYQSIVMADLADKMADLQQGNSVDISQIVEKPRKPLSLKILECTEECRIVERNRRLAIGLQIRNPDLSAKLTPRYSDYMRNWAKKDPKFCQHVHDKLTELVQLAKQSKQKSRSYSFESMNRDKRHFVHEYCEHFGCDSAAYDAEPNRNVVATAIKDKSWLPSVSLLELIQRESGQRRVPGPMVSVGSAWKQESVPLRWPSRTTRPPTPPGEYADCFNN